MGSVVDSVGVITTGDELYRLNFEDISVKCRSIITVNILETSHSAATQTSFLEVLEVGVLGSRTVGEGAQQEH